ncbi:AMP-binding protein [Halalkalibaculum sp. DA3122]|uniref:AMP-binding protein n=1 Tax=Halalkalibaculum sp. DA3122 TaxID=3373607 RepID=UPI00375412CE
MAKAGFFEQTNRYVLPNLIDYGKVYDSFRWDKYVTELSGLPDGGLNIAYEAVDRHAGSSLRNRIAIRWLGRDGSTEEFSYRRLKEVTDRFANVLQELGIGKGAVVSTLAGRIPDLYIAALGAFKQGSVFCPLSPASGQESIFRQLNEAKARVLVTTEAHYRHTLEKGVDQLPHLEYILLTDVDKTQDRSTYSLKVLMSKADKQLNICPTDPDDAALFHFTRGATGKPKGVIHVHKAALTHYITGKFVLDFHRDDIFWCTADPGRATGIIYGLLSPLLHGITNLVVEAECDAPLWYQTLEEEMVTVWYTAPSDIRHLMQSHIDVNSELNLNALRLVQSGGEPLHPEAARWSLETLDMPVLEHWWQAETGGIMIANFPGMKVKPGSVGRPLPGISAAIVQKGKSGKRLRFVEEPGETGQLALKAGWTSMFRGYLGQARQYSDSFVDGWYLTGDWAQKDADGYFWILDRAEQGESKTAP